MNDKEQTQSRPGERSFAVALLLLGAAAFAASLRLWLRMPEPRAASAAALPLLSSGIWVLVAAWNAIEAVFRRDGASGGGRGARLRFALPADVLRMLALIAAYCALLYLGASFYWVTPLFLYGGMCALARKGYLKNLVWTAALMATMVLVFHVLLGVTFP